jgi:hypothetical protein
MPHHGTLRAKVQEVCMFQTGKFKRNFNIQEKATFR